MISVSIIPSFFSPCNLHGGWISSIDFLMPV